ncbi:SMP-30/gluconolactonase/LRE family protein [Aquisalimonas sp.]|uniref:SMP-30/gluconolactonase/LRE family protein n=1 Tax=unclassified Aquisalimonas TaxID=2644645 RepID=UPI0025BEAAAB|nr:SMP-30/gluconolactonase/LRE family protein [Aquisalimonas sp.]
MTRQARTLLTGGAFFEGPRWRDGQWWVSDFYRHGVYTVTPEGTATRILDVPAQPSGLGWMPDGSLLVVSMGDRRLLRRWPDGSVTPHADLSDHAAWHCNDMVVDAQGRAWVGNFGFDLMQGADPATTGLLRVDPDGGIARVADDLAFPNGMAITPDGATLLVGETFRGRYTAFTINADGSLSDRRTWAQLGPEPALTTRRAVTEQLETAPDGCCLDAEGCLWVADAMGQRCLRVAPGGTIVDTVTADGQGVFACMLGGADGRTLLLCCAPDSSERRRRAALEATLMTCTVDIPHAGLP